MELNHFFQHLATLKVLILLRKFPTVIQAYNPVSQLHGNYMHLSHVKLALILHTLESVKRQCYSMIQMRFLPEISISNVSVARCLTSELYMKHISLIITSWMVSAYLM